MIVISLMARKAENTACLEAVTFPASHNCKPIHFWTLMCIEMGSIYFPNRQFRLQFAPAFASVNHTPTRQTVLGAVALGAANLSSPQGLLSPYRLALIPNFLGPFDFELPALVYRRDLIQPHMQMSFALAFPSLLLLPLLALKAAFEAARPICPRNSALLPQLLSPHLPLPSQVQHRAVLQSTCLYQQRNTRPTPFSQVNDRQCGLEAVLHRSNSCW